MKTWFTRFAGISVLAFFATAGFAADTKSVEATKDDAKAEYKAAKTQAKAEYKAAKEQCKARTGNDQDVCMKEAKATYTRATADAKAKMEGNEAAADAIDDKLVAEYKVAKEKCDALSGNAKDTCIADAKAKYQQ